MKIRTPGSAADAGVSNLLVIYAALTGREIEDLDAARGLVDSFPDVTAVTRDGDVLGAHFASGGSSSQPSLIEVQAAVDEAARSGAAR